MKKLVSLFAAVLLFTGVCSALVTPAQGAVASPAAITIDTSSQSAVRDAYLNVFVPNKGVSSGWSGGSVNSCQPGTTTDAFRTATIKTVNYYRALAGLRSVVEDAASTTQAQQAALIMDANNTLSHSPDPSWACYTAAGATGANNSNIAWTSGSWSGTETLPLWMSDVDIPDVGHRNAILYPPLGKVGVGQTTQGGALLWMASSLWTNSRVSGGVGWPSANYFPYENVPDSGYWSYSQPGVDFSSKTVTVTKNGVSVTGISYGERTNWGTGYSPDSHIVWKMPTLTAPAAGVTDIYRVTISGIGSYDVKVFSATATPPTPPTPAATVASVSITGTPRVGNLLTASLGTVTPADATKAYLWYRNGVAITGATNATYTVAAADVGQTITVRVTVSKSGYTSGSLTSASVVATQGTGYAANSSWSINSAGPLTVGTGSSSTYTATAIVRDALNNPVSGAVVTVKSAQSGVTFPAGATCTTNTAGQCSVSVYSTLAGTFELSAWLGTDQIGVSTARAWTQGAVSAANSSIAVNTNSVAVGGTVTATATARDANRNLVPGVVVSFAKTGSASLSAASCTTGSTGTCTVTLTDSLAESIQVSATVVEGGVTTPIQASPQTVTFNSTPSSGLDLSQSFFSVTSGPVVADGVQAYTGYLIARDSSGRSLPGLALTDIVFGASSSNVNISPVNDFGNGTYTVTYTTTIASNAYTASLNYKTAKVGTDQPIPFIASAAAPTVGPVDLGRSSLSSSSAQVAGSPIVATVIAQDAQGTPVKGLNASQVVVTGVSNTAGVPDSALEITSFVEVGDGRYTYSLTSKLAGTFTLSVRVDGVVLNQHPLATLVHGEICVANCTPVDPANVSRVVVTKNAAEANGSDQAQATVYAYDRFGNAVRDASVETTTSDWSLTRVNPTRTTLANGTAVLAYTSTSAGAKIAGVTVDSKTLTGSPITLIFRNSGPDLVQSALSVSPGTQEVGKSLTATAVIKDGAGNVLPGVTVTFGVSGSATLSSVTATTDSNGQALVTLTDKKAEFVSVRATVKVGVNDQEISGSPASVWFTPGPVCVYPCVADTDVPNDRRTRVDVTVNNQLANGFDTNVALAWAFDKYGNPVADVYVESTPLDAGLRVHNGITLTGPDGSARITYSATAGGLHQARITLNGQHVFFAPQPGSAWDNPTDQAAHSSPATLTFEAQAAPVRTGGWLSNLIELIRAFLR